MTVKPRSLRCYVEREKDGSWFAICIDLNVSAQGDTAFDVKQNLRVQVQRYVREALTIDIAYADSLLQRRAPWPFVAKYYFFKALSALVGTKRLMATASRARIFTERVPDFVA